MLNIIRLFWIYIEIYCKFYIIEKIVKRPPFGFIVEVCCYSYFLPEQLECQSVSNKSFLWSVFQFWVKRHFKTITFQWKFIWIWILHKIHYHICILVALIMAQWHSLLWKCFYIKPLHSPVELTSHIIRYFLQRQINGIFLHFLILFTQSKWWKFQ